MLTAVLDPAKEQRIGAYTLIRRVDAGEMGEVFVAADASSGGSKTPVALKRIVPDLADREEYRQLLADEATLCTRMTHRNLVPAMDVGAVVSDGFFTMPYIDGFDLLSLLRVAARTGQPLSDGAALHLVQQVATGLHHAHEMSDPSGRPLEVVHCDVSLSNVMVTLSGEVKLIDWGIARGRHVTRSVPELARGTLGYSSPEHTQGLAVDRRADVFSLGVLLWELTLMRRLFRGVNRADTAMRVANSVIPHPGAERSGYPEPLEDIVMRALARDPQGRIVSALRLDIELERFARRTELSNTEATLAQWVHGVRARSSEVTAP